MAPACTFPPKLGRPCRARSSDAGHRKRRTLTTAKKKTFAETRPQAFRESTLAAIPQCRGRSLPLAHHAVQGRSFMRQSLLACLLATGTVAATATPSLAVKVAHQGFDPSPYVDFLLTGAGHTPTSMTAADIENGLLITGEYDVFVMS